MKCFSLKNSCRIFKYVPSRNNDGADNKNRTKFFYQCFNRSADTEPMLFHTIRAPQFPETCILPSVTSRRLKMTDRRMAEEICSNVAANMVEFCIQDVMLTGDKDIAHSYGF